MEPGPILTGDEPKDTSYEKRKKMWRLSPRGHRLEGTHGQEQVGPAATESCRTAPGVSHRCSRIRGVPGGLRSWLRRLSYRALSTHIVLAHTRGRAREQGGQRRAAQQESTTPATDRFLFHTLPLSPTS